MLLVIFYLSNLELSSHAVQILSSFKDDIIKSDSDPVALATSLNKEKILSDEALAVIKEAESKALMLTYAQYYLVL